MLVAGVVPAGAGVVPAGAGVVPAGAGVVPAGAGVVTLVASKRRRRKLRPIGTTFAQKDR